MLTVEFDMMFGRYLVPYNEQHHPSRNIRLSNYWSLDGCRTVLTRITLGKDHDLATKLHTHKPDHVADILIQADTTGAWHGY